MKLFSNGSQYMDWQSTNCDKCNKYECESETIEEAGCRFAFELDMAEDVSDELLSILCKKEGDEYYIWKNCPLRNKDISSKKDLDDINEYYKNNLFNQK